MMKKPENDEAREFEEKFREVPYFGGLDPLYNVVLALHASVPKKQLDRFSSIDTAHEKDRQNGKSLSECQLYFIKLHVVLL